MREKKRGLSVKVFRLEHVLILVLLASSASTVAAQQSSTTTTTQGQGTSRGHGITSQPDSRSNTQSGNPQSTSPTQTGAASGAQGQGNNGSTNGAGSSGTGMQGSGIVGGQPSNRGTGSITGGRQISGAARVSAAPATLSLQQAVELAIQNNLSTLLARERRREAEGFRQESLSGLLPNINGTTYQANITQNLAALGFQPGTFPGLGSTFIGPFNNFDARLRLEQTIFSLSAIRNYQVGRAGVHVAELQEQLAREEVASGTALTYLEALRAERAVTAAQSNVELAQALFTLAQDQRDAGVATGVDVTRAETRLSIEQVRLAQAQTSSDQARLNLQRVVGLPLEGALTLTDQLRFTDEPLPQVETAISQAGENRREVRIAEEQIRTSELERKAVRAEFLPSLEFVGDYGVSGITPTNTALPTRRAAIQLNVPVFNGGLTQGRLAVAASRARQAELEFGSVRGQVEEDVRLALVTLRTTAAQVRAADQSVALSERELEMSRDRFRAGVADNLEVINAQTSLANARDVQVSVLALYNAARLNLAAALGRAEEFRW
jgi:outer membrane protein TolC